MNSKNLTRCKNPVQFFARFSQILANSQHFFFLISLALSQPLQSSAFYAFSFSTYPPPLSLSLVFYPRIKKRVFSYASFDFSRRLSPKLSFCHQLSGAEASATIQSTTSANSFFSARSFSFFPNSFSDSFFSKITNDIEIVSKIPESRAIYLLSKNKASLHHLPIALTSAGQLTETEKKSFATQIRLASAYANIRSLSHHHPMQRKLI